jgi:hypothetical protein
VTASLNIDVTSSKIQLQSTVVVVVTWVYLAVVSTDPVHIWAKWFYLKPYANVIRFFFSFWCQKITNLDYDEHKGRIAIGRVHAGRMRKGMEVKVNFGVLDVFGLFGVEIFLILSELILKYVVANDPVLW